MAISVNRAYLVGRVGADPEARGRDGEIVVFRIATSESWKNKQGEKQERTSWHSIVVFAEQTARFVKQYVRKGDLVFVEGTIETRKFQDQSGADRYTTEIIVRPYSGQVQLQSKQTVENTRSDDPPGDYGRGSSDSGGYQSRRDLDDEIPF